MEQLQLGGDHGPMIYAESWKDAAGLFAKLAKIMGELEPVKKEGRAPKSIGGYPFQRYEDVAAALRSKLAEAGVAFMASINGDKREIITTAKGTPMISAVLDMTFMFADSATGAVALFPWRGEANDTSDKATSKAITLGLKYFLLRSFLLSSDEPDPDTQGIPRGNGRRAAASKRWVTDAQAIERMFAEAAKIDLSQADVHLALLVDDIRDFDGAKAEAWEMITNYAARKNDIPV